MNTYAHALTEMLSHCTWFYISCYDGVPLSLVLTRWDLIELFEREGGETKPPFGCKLKVHFISNELQCFNMKNHSLTHSF